MTSAGRVPLAVCLLGVLLGGCDVFKPADPEPPSRAGLIPIYDTPDQTLATLAAGLADKGRTNGLTAYLGGFAESTSTATPAYHHWFWPADAAAWSGISGRPVPEDWGRALEQNFYVQFVSLRADDYLLQWVEDEANPDDIRESQAVVHRRYRVYTQTTDGDITNTIAGGFADLTLIRDEAGAWRIVRWDDRVDPDVDPGDPEQVTLGRRRLNTQ